MKLIYFLVFLLFTTTAAEAQQKRDTLHAPSTQQKAKMKKELGLTDKQAADLKAANKDYKQKEAKIKGDTKLTEAQKTEQLKQLKEEKKKEVDAILTPEQKEKAKALKQEKKDKKKAEKAKK